MSKVIILPLHPRLGRHVQHDPRSLKFAAGVLPKSAIQPVHWERRVPIFDQGELGSCTGNAGAGWVATDNISRQGIATVPPTEGLNDGSVDEEFAVGLYEMATQLDDIPQQYPPEDTGSSGLGVAKALQKLGLLTAYDNAFSFDALASGLQFTPCLLGVAWYNSMFDTRSDGHIIYHPSSGLAGGHEILATQLEVGSDGKVSRVWIDNSWGTSWGVNGRAYLTGDEMTRLLQNDGDVVVPNVQAVPVPVPTPTPTNDSLIITINDAEVISHIRNTADRHDMTVNKWTLQHFKHYFGV